MPTFDTPEPISATIDLVIGDVRITAGDRDTTVVEVRPSDPSNDEDLKAAEQTRVEYANGQLLVKAPKLRSWLPGQHRRLGRRDGRAARRLERARRAGSWRTSTPTAGSATCRIKTGLGRIRVDEADTLSLKSGAGDITVDRATGDAEVTAGSGDVRVRELDGSAVIKNSNGDTWVGVAARRRCGSTRPTAASPSTWRNAGVVAKSANGDVRLGEVVRGSVVLETKVGDLEVGIREGTAAWLDVSASAGQACTTRSTAADAPGPSAETVEVRARTSVGDIVIRRP